MPTRERSLGRLVLGSLTLVPSTLMSPFWNGSSALTALISVDLPDPDGPQTTMTSPFSQFVVQSASTWKLPYHLDTSRISIIGMVRFLRDWFGDGACRVSGRWRSCAAAASRAGSPQSR